MRIAQDAFIIFRSRHRDIEHIGAKIIKLMQMAILFSIDTRENDKQPLIALKAMYSAYSQPWNAFLIELSSDQLRLLAERRNNPHS